MRTFVKRWGHSAAVRLPSALLAAAQVAVDQPVEIREEGGRIIIEKLAPERYDMNELVSGITEENRHDPVDTGLPVGREIS